MLLLLLLASAVSCRRSSGPSWAASASASTNQQLFAVKGVIQSLNSGSRQVIIKHDEIPGYMPAMTMPFEVRDTNELAGLTPGQAVSFRLIVTDTDGWVDQLRALAPAATNGPPQSSPLRRVRDVEPLGPGDLLPQYWLTNQFGQPFSTAAYKGQALAITFLFTRCPFPTFCPRMAANFEEVQRTLLSDPDGPVNWQLLTVSFDPEFDTPAILKPYAEAHHYDSRHWTFATGSLLEVTALGEQFGLAFWRDQPGTLSHNLRTAVVDASGRVRKILEGNAWTSPELTAEIRKGAEQR